MSIGAYFVPRFQINKAARMRPAPITIIHSICAVPNGNVASRRASSQSSDRRWSSMDSNFHQAACQTSCSSHIRNRRQQVEPSGCSGGISRHLAPVRKIHRMPSKHERFEAQGRPRRSLRRFGSGNRGHNTSHCDALSNTCRFFCLMPEDQQTVPLTRKSLV